MYLRLKVILLLWSCCCVSLLAQEVDEFLLQASKLVEQQQPLKALELLEKGLQHYPENAELLIQAGGLYIHLGRTSEGEDLLDRALLLDPNNPDILNRQGEAKLREGKLQEAVARFRRALWHESRDARAHHQLAFTLFLQGKEKEALEHARQAVEFSPLDPGYRRFHALLLNLAGKREEGYQELRKAWRLDPQNPEILYQLSDRSVDRGQVGQALEYAEMAWHSDSQNPLYAHHLAELYRRVGGRREAEEYEEQARALDGAFARYSEALKAQGEGRLEAAAALLEESLEEHPGFEIALFHLAQLYSRMGRKELALASYQKLLALNPENQAAREEEAWLHATQGSLEKALILLAESKHESANQRLLAGYQALQQKNWEKAVDLLGGVLKENPLTPGLLELLAFAFREVDEPEKALSYLAKAGDLTSTEEVQGQVDEVHLTQAQKLQQAQRWGEAIQIYSTLLEHNPRNTTYLFNRAYCRQQSGQLAAAVQDYRAALSKERQEWAELNLASCLYRLQRYPEAVEAWETVVKSSPTADRYYRLGLSYAHVERNAEAEAAFSKAQQKGLSTPALLYNLGLARLKTFRVEEGWQLIREAASKGYPPAAQLVARLPRRP